MYLGLANLLLLESCADEILFPERALLYSNGCGCNGRATKGWYSPFRPFGV
jgi:hypothetical protein